MHIVRDLTPDTHRCGIGACPAVFETDRGTIVLVGKVLSDTDRAQLAERIGEGEVAIEIPRDLIQNV